MATISEPRLAELRAVVAFEQWRAFQDKRWAYLNYAKAQIDFWKERWLYHAGQLTAFNKKR